MGVCYGQSSLETDYVQRKSCVQGHSRVGGGLLGQQL